MYFVLYTDWLFDKKKFFVTLCLIALGIESWKGSFSPKQLRHLCLFCTVSLSYTKYVSNDRLRKR